MTDETTALLIRARGFIVRGWCRNADAKDETGQAVHAGSPEAVAWCAYGALKAAGSYVSLAAVLRLERAIGGGSGFGEGIGRFNDLQQTVEPVLAAFDRAIAAGGTTAAAPPPWARIAEAGDSDAR